MYALFPLNLISYRFAVKLNGVDVNGESVESVGYRHVLVILQLLQHGIVVHMTDLYTNQSYSRPNSDIGVMC